MLIPPPCEVRTPPEKNSGEKRREETYQASIFGMSHIQPASSRKERQVGMVSAIPQTIWTEYCTV